MPTSSARSITPEGKWITYPSVHSSRLWRGILGTGLRHI
jgi:hypothetical protein